MAQLLDQYGQPIDTRRLREEQAAPETGGVRQVVGGHPAQGLTPSRLGALLAAAELGDIIAYCELAEEMEEKDLHYLAVLGTRKRQVSQLEISVEPAGEDAAAEKHAELVRAFVDRDTLQDELVDILDAVGKGFSITEIVWETSASQWMPLRLEWRMPQWFEFDRTDGRTPLLRTASGTEKLAPYKFIVHFHKAKSGLPIRGGLARAVAWWYLFKNYAVKDWITFAEIFGQPIRVGKYGPGATVEDKAALLRALTNIGSDAAAMIPQSMMMEFVNHGSATANAQLYENFCNYVDQQTSKAVLGQTATTDAIAGGHAVGQEHNDVRGDIERSDCRQLSAVLTQQLARPIVDLNFGPQKAYPRIVIGRPEQVDRTQLADALAKTVPLGLRVGQREVREKLGLSEPGDDDELLTPPAGPGLGVDAGAAGDDGGGQARPSPADTRTARPHATATAAAADDSGDAVDQLVADMLAGEGWEEVMAPIVGGLDQFLDEAGDLETARDRLAEALRGMDPGAFAEKLARGLFAARLGGAVGAPLSDAEDDTGGA
ncbi:MAG: DUF935 domain-containing protein [Alphaproteobacteria bacterium]